MPAFIFLDDSIFQQFGGQSQTMARSVPLFNVDSFVDFAISSKGKFVLPGFDEFIMRICSFFYIARSIWRQQIRVIQLEHQPRVRWHQVERVAHRIQELDHTGKVKSKLSIFLRFYKRKKAEEENCICIAC